MDRLHIETLLMIVLVFFANNVPIASAAYAAFFAFGDSILDTGNNNNLETFSKCNYPPYGRDFNGGIPTGRFCNGKVPSDLIAKGLGIKDTLPAYNDPNLRAQYFPTGVCFSSGGSGSDNVTSCLLIDAFPIICQSLNWLDLNFPQAVQAILEKQGTQEHGLNDKIAELWSIVVGDHVGDHVWALFFMTDCRGWLELNLANNLVGDVPVNYNSVDVAVLQRKKRKGEAEKWRSQAAAVASPSPAASDHPVSNPLSLHTTYKNSSKPSFNFAKKERTFT
ncbi:hypothetical protein RIF29_27475 [Crotalaria pallida]|uniref:GDSL esterase/lipase n=1 Tax=Crotalaria pallida TaxID=3830 RepID=A0AAN9ERB7_CROPI